MRSVNLQLGLNSFWQEREGGEGRLRAAGQDPGSPPGPLGRGAPGAAPRRGAARGVGTQEPASGHGSRRVWDPLFQLCPAPLPLVRPLPGGSVRPTDP